MANFTPDFKPYTGQGKFRYWVQRVLPTIYDDSLSYMELLNKVVYALNLVIEDMDAVEDNVAALLTSFNELQDYVNEYFDNLDVTQEIEEKLDKMAEDGELSTLLAPFIPELVTAWLDENVTPTTPVIDKSLNIIDAAADAKTVGDYVFPIDNGNIEVGEFIEDSYVTTTGEIREYEGWHRTDYIEVDPTKPLYITKFGSGSAGRYCSMYDENKNFIVAFPLQAGENFRPLTYNAKYIMLSDENTIYYRIGTHSRVYDMEVVKHEYTQGNLFPMYGWRNANLKENGTFDYSYERIVSDKIPVIPSATILFDNLNEDYDIYAAVYDENDALITSMVYGDPQYELPHNAAYIRLVVKTTTENPYLYPSDIPKTSFKVTYLTEPFNNNAFEVITFNVGEYNYGVDYGIPSEIYEEKIANYRNFLGDKYPIVIGMQEFSTVIRKMPEVRSEPALWDAYYPYGYRTGSQTAIKTRVPVNDGGYHQLITTPDRYYVDAYTVINGKQVYLISVHLSPQESDTAKRQAELTEIKAILDQHEYAICFGDFNPWPGEEAELYGILTNAGYKLANMGEHGEFWTWSTNRDDFNHYDNPTGTVFYIDNIVVTPNIDILNVEAINTYNYLTSDHIPIKAKLNIK